jgi:hypothetical protein
VDFDIFIKTRTLPANHCKTKKKPPPGHDGGAIVWRQIKRIRGVRVSSSGAPASTLRQRGLGEKAKVFVQADDAARLDRKLGGLLGKLRPLVGVLPTVVSNLNDYVRFLESARALRLAGA